MRKNKVFNTFARFSEQLGNLNRVRSVPTGPKEGGAEQHEEAPGLDSMSSIGLEVILMKSFSNCQIKIYEFERTKDKSDEIKKIRWIEK